MNGNSRSRDESGSILIIVPVALLLGVGLVVAALHLSTTNMSDANVETRKLQSHYMAKMGIERQVYDMKQATGQAVLVNAFSGIEDFHDKKTYNNSIKMQAFPAPPNQTPLLDMGAPIDAAAELVAAGVIPSGTFDVSIHIEGFDPLNPGAMSSTRRFVTIRSTGWVPSKTDPLAVSHTIETTVLVELSSSEVFDYAYFINNWGWFYGNSITSGGNVRSNGQFDAGGFAPTIDGSPRYLGANGTDLYGYIDDNNDGNKDGNDGGIFAGRDIVNSAGVQGMGGNPINQHDFTESVSMPNLTDLALYEQHAIDSNSSISIGGSQVANAVVGDEAGEQDNLYLEGTLANPIELNGAVVVRGSVIVKGYVQGQGVIYAGGNVYIADDIQYVNPPTSPRPPTNSEADFEAWLQANQTADAFGLFAREHVVMGDYTDTVWQYYVDWWMGHPANKSEEDAGLDGIPNTLDAGEENGVFDVTTYTQTHADLGLIPPGKAIGDIIPGSGEDIDGDGVYDPQVSITEMNLPAALQSGQWDGNVPAGATQYSDVATVDISNFDAALYTNHALAGYIKPSNFFSTIRFNGCVVSRNESIIYNAIGLEVNHDARLLGGGDNFGYFLPRIFKDIRFMKTWDSVPNIHFDGQTGANSPHP